jgi:hypothetical protein
LSPGLTPWLSALKRGSDRVAVTLRPRVWPNDWTRTSRTPGFRRGLMVARGRYARWNTMHFPQVGRVTRLVGGRFKLRHPPARVIGND